MNGGGYHRGPGRPTKNPPLVPRQAQALDPPPELLRQTEDKAIHEQGNSGPLEITREAYSRKCGACEFYLARFKGSAGECRRYPPIPGFGDFVFPVVHEGSWCGEFQPRQA